MDKKNELQIYTDGSCFPNPGNGGWSWCSVKDNKLVEWKNGFTNETTSNRMEYTALIKSLEHHREYADLNINVFSDSQLLVNTFNTWMFSWKEKNWKKGNVKNLDLVLGLYDLNLFYGKRLKLNWIKAHTGHKWNEFADSLCDVTSNKDVVIYKNQGFYF